MSDGILLVDKPAGMTSADVVRAIKRRHGLERIGHLGTLDPMATGLLPLCVGAGTKIAQFLNAESKAYRGTIGLGFATDTMDVTGQTVAEAEVPPFSWGRLEAVARALLGPQTQVPPMYSAVKVGGRELYKHARAGVTVERAARAIVIESLTLSALGADQVEFAVRCSKGTYVRVLAEEVGRGLGTLATLASLRRTEFGPFRVEAAVPLERLLEPGAELAPIGVLPALSEARHLVVDDATAFAIAAGQPGGIRRLEPPARDEKLGAVLAPDGRLLAVVAREGSAWRLCRVLLPEAVQLYRP
jgi:tRNA pseudouridine55 synthase